MNISGRSQGSSSNYLPDRLDVLRAITMTPHLTPCLLPALVLRP
jgi:hypothetical protein